MVICISQYRQIPALRRLGAWNLDIPPFDVLSAGTNGSQVLCTVQREGDQLCWAAKANLPLVGRAVTDGAC